MRDEIGGVVESMTPYEFVSLSLLGIPKSWHNYHDSINGRDKFPDWEKLWSDLVHEEIIRIISDGVTC